MNYRAGSYNETGAAEAAEYPQKADFMHKTSVKNILTTASAGETITVCGWLKSARHGKGDSFLALSDGSCFHDLQIVCPVSLPEYESTIRHLGTGCALRVHGLTTLSPGTGQRIELLAEEVELVGAAGADYPLQKKRHSFEYLREIAHLRMRTNTFGAVMRVRNVAARSIHNFFQSRGFLWLHSPIITASDCEGAGEMFRVTTLDPLTPPRTPEGATDFAQDFFGRASHLTVSGQLEGEIAALALSNIYTFGPTFRAENSHTSRHLAEFWMVEPEMAFCELAGNMDLAEEFLKNLFADVMREAADDMEFFSSVIDPETREIMRLVIEQPFERITYTEAVRILENSGVDFKFPVSWGCDLQSEHERYLTEEHFRKPVIVSDYPRQIKAFYMYQNDDGKTVRAMDVLVPRVGEIIGGSQREDRLPLLEQRIEEMGLRREDYWWYLDLRRYGSVPHSGFGLGFERVIQFMTGMKNIRDVIPFPRTPGSADF